MATTSNAASDYLEQAALEHFFGYMSYTSPSSIDIALHYNDPLDDDSGGSELDSMNDPGYSRVTLSSPSTDLSISTDGVGYAVSPMNTVTFTATGNWSNAPTWVACYDDSSNLLFRAELDDGSGNALSALTSGQSLELTSSNLKFKLS
jgi:hypothetical protein